MRVCRHRLAPLSSLILYSAIALVLAGAAFGQGAFEAQIRGTVTDQSGATVANATVTITNDGTGVAQVVHTDDHGLYFIVGLRPAVYTIKAESKGFRVSEKTNVVLQVDQQTTVDFLLHPAGINETMEVTTTAPLLDTESATLGSEITSEYINDLPLMNRSFFGLTFLAAGVTEVSGAGASDNYPSGTNFTSNGQRNATAEMRLDGALISAPEQGEGGNSNVYYEPLVEGMQEMKVQNNSFSAEFGNNGGTVVNMVMKSGTDEFHGAAGIFCSGPGSTRAIFSIPSTWWVAPGCSTLNRTASATRVAFRLGGPIKKDRPSSSWISRRCAASNASSGVATVPTLAERNGRHFSNTTNAIYDPTAAGCGVPCVTRPQVQYNGQLNVIPPGEQLIPSEWLILNLYPKPSNSNEFNNYNFTDGISQPGLPVRHQGGPPDQRQEPHRGRYSRGWYNFTRRSLWATASTMTESRAA